MSCLARSLALPLSLTLAGCGGGGSDSGPAQPAPQSAFGGTAYQELEVTSTLRGEQYGPGRAVAQLQIDQCNSQRNAYYGLPPVAPSDALLASLDVLIEQRYFDTDKAATYVTAKGPVMHDMQRWLDEFTQLHGALPASPPDCADLEAAEVITGYLWRDGIRYELRFSSRQAIGDPSTDDFVPRTLASAEEVQALASQTLLGERCHLVSNLSSVLANGDACVWDRFPLVAYLGWPWALSRHESTGNVERTARALELSRGPIDPSKFEIPASFTTTMLQPR